MNNHYEYKISNNFLALNSLCQQVTELLIERQLSEKKRYTVMLALEEMVSNIIKYGYDDDKLHHICINFYFNDDIKLTISDNGHHFDPLQNRPDSLSANIEERQIGGMGIHLTKNMVQSITHDRNNGSNILTIII
jgi:anti-sigma regulatory factor (Ser/Thr protein kinase)